MRVRIAIASFLMGVALMLSGCGRTGANTAAAARGTATTPKFVCENTPSGYS